MELLYRVRAALDIRRDLVDLRDHPHCDQVAQFDASEGVARLLSVVHCGRSVEDRRTGDDLSAHRVSAAGAVDLCDHATDLDSIARHDWVYFCGPCEAKVVL